jgi:hypothetical protein
MVGKIGGDDILLHACFQKKGISSQRSAGSFVRGFSGLGLTAFGWGNEN